MESLDRAKAFLEPNYFPCLPPPRPARARGWCKHYGYENTGLKGFREGRHGGPTCEAGEDNRTLPGASGACMPDDLKGPLHPCPKREEWTEEERAAFRAWGDEHLARMLLIGASDQLPDAKDGRGKSGIFDCPACGVGKVHWARAAYNGHLHARCSTPMCFEVIQ